MNTGTDSCGYARRWQYSTLAKDQMGSGSGFFLPRASITSHISLHVAATMTKRRPERSCQTPGWDRSLRRWVHAIIMEIGMTMSLSLVMKKWIVEKVFLVSARACRYKRNHQMCDPQQYLKKHGWLSFQKLNDMMSDELQKFKKVENYSRKLSKQTLVATQHLTQYTWWSSGRTPIDTLLRKQVHPNKISKAEPREDAALYNWLSGHGEGTLHHLREGKGDLAI